MNSNIIAKANQIIKNCSEGYFSVVNQQGYPNVATRSNIKPEGIYSCYFATDTSGAMGNAIKLISKTSVCFREGSNNVTLVGDSEIIGNKETRLQLWQDWFINHFPKGPEDPEYCLVKFTTKQLSLWIDSETSVFNLNQITTPQSYCGLICSGCKYRNTHNCKGCFESKGNPFYGECPIGKCCQEKGLEHCGLCSQFPCDQLNEYSCGNGEQCDKPKGARLEILKMWKG